MMCDQAMRNNVVSNRAQQQIDAVGSHRPRCRGVLSHPRGREWYQGQPKQQVCVGPKDATADSLSRLKHVVMVVPINRQEDEAERVNGDQRQCLKKVTEILSLGHM